jgi:hypothetical protein
MLEFRYRFSLALITLVVSFPACWAQQQTQQPSSQQDQNQTAQPIPAYRSPLASAADNGAVQDTSAEGEQFSPDNHLPAGAQDLSLGAPKTSHGYWSPYVYASSDTYSNPTLGSGTQWSTFASLSGGINLRKISSNSDLTLTYLAGGSISSDGSDNSVVQQFGVAERYSLHRSVIVLIDQFGYLPQASFGYNGLGTGGLGGLGIGGLGTGTLNTNGSLGLQNGLTPVESILTATGQNVSNSSIVELDRFLTRRSSLTFLGTYSLTDYIGSSLTNSKEAIFQAGYNHQLSAKTTIALFYRFDAFRYSNISQSINDNSIQASYARRLAGRLAFLVSAGPDFVVSTVPISTVGSSATTGKTTQFFWDLNTQLTYQWRRAQLQASYGHGVTAGSGVLAGSVTDIVSGVATRQVTHTLSATWTMGYSRNSGAGILTTPASTSITQNYDYNYWFTGVNLTRTFGRSTNVYLGYQVQYQDSSSRPCPVAPCSTSFVNHQIYAGLGWNPRRLIR